MSRSALIGSYVALMALAALVSPAHAGDASDPDYAEMSLAELMNIPVTAASGFEQRTAAAPSSVTILTRRDLQAFGYRTLAEAVSSAAGIYATYDRSYHYLGVRGFGRPGDYNTRVLVLINGVRVNDQIYDTGKVGGDFPLDLNLIDRIEIVRGPSSSLYGSSAFFAVINVITRDTQDITPAEATLSAGSYDAYSGRFSVAHAFGEKGSVLLSGSLLSSEGPDLYFPAFDSPENNNGVAESLDGENLGSLFLHGRYGNWTLQAVYSDRRKERPTASYGTLFNDPDGEDRDAESLVSVAWAGELAKGWDGLFRVGWQRYQYRGYWPYDYADEEDPQDRWVDRDEAVSEYVGGEARGTAKVIPRNTVTAGLEVRHSYRVDQSYVAAGERILDSREDQAIIGLYLQDEIDLASWALVNAGIRYDHLEPYGDHDISPRIALILWPAEGSTLKLIYGDAFRSPNAYERFYDDGGVSTKANPLLDPETIRTYEVVWEQRVAEEFHVNTALYRYDIDGLISQDVDPADGLLVFQNLDAVEAYGGEVDAILDLPAGAAIRGSYAYCRTEDPATGGRLSNSPEHMVKLNMLVPVITSRVTAGVEVQYLSDRLTDQGAETENYTLLNATLLSRQLVRNLDASLGVYNLFDTRYTHPVSDTIEGAVLEQDGRTFRFELTYRLRFSR